ncbi:MAG: DNA-processing protein DprA [Clostridia bacterium]|nr:DNA-processing protein DprA [Clostridia bacterium]
MNYKVINFEDIEYPESLRMIENAPKKIYAMGNINLLKDENISVVGTRRISDYGKRYGKEICKDLVLRDIPIVSGLAIGTDTLAHETALRYGGKTIAVLPSGFENIFPQKNEKLAKEIVEKGGLLVSEYSPETVADSNKFLERNRIVAGLGIALVVIEALKISGTSVTARIAKSQGKKVFALPGSLDSKYSVGTNNLIKNGANLITSAVDIVKSYPQFDNRKLKTEASQNIKEEYKKIFFNIFSDKYLSLEEIIKKTGMPTREVITKLTLMELEEIVEQEIGKGYRRKI